MQIYNLFKKLGYSKKWAEIYILLHKFGTKPASTIAKMLGTERTNTYKTLQSMMRAGIIAETNRKGVKYFFVPNKNVITNIVKEQKKIIEETEGMLPAVEAELNELTKNQLFSLPPMRFFEGKDGVQNALSDIIDTLQETGYKVIKLFASNTLEAQSVSSLSFGDYAKSFFKQIDKMNVSINAYLGNGIMILENIMKNSNIPDIQDLPAGYSSTYIMIIGNILYFFSFKDIPTCIKITDEGIADMMSLLLKSVG